VALPFTAIPDILAPDDVLSYQHMNRLVDRANDADAALARQHWTYGGRRGQHLGETPGIAVAMLIVSPPSDIAATDNHTVHVQAGYVSDTSWGVTTYNNADDYAVFRCSAPGPEYIWYGACVQSSFSGTPTLVTPDNMMCIHPAVHVEPNAERGPTGLLRSSSLKVGFGKTDVAQIVHFTVLIFGATRTGNGPLTGYTVAP
jgi:hypothetical protein